MPSFSDHAKIPNIDMKPATLVASVGAAHDFNENSATLRLDEFFDNLSISNQTGDTQAPTLDPWSYETEQQAFQSSRFHANTGGFTQRRSSIGDSYGGVTDVVYSTPVPPHFSADLSGYSYPTLLNLEEDILYDVYCGQDEIGFNLVSKWT